MTRPLPPMTSLVLFGGREHLDFQMTPSVRSVFSKVCILYKSFTLDDISFILSFCCLSVACRTPLNQFHHSLSEKILF